MGFPSRRGFLKKTLGACWTGATLLDQSLFRATQARAQSSPGLPRLFDIEKVADGVYAAIARPVALLNSNAAIFENAGDLLVVDTHSKPSAVAALVAQIKKEITTKPVRYVVNSHFHWDHSQGTAAYLRGNSRVDVIASEATRRLLDEHGGARLRESVEQTRKMVPLYKEKLAAARTPEEKAYYERMARESEQYLAEMRNYTPELPNVTFREDLIIHDKAHDLHLAFRGRAHTAGDVVVFCPQKKVVATGDLLHGFAPFIGDGYPREWPRTLLRIAELPFERVATGHGPVQNNRDRLYQKRDYIEELTEAVARGRSAGAGVEKLQNEITPDKLKSLDSGGYGRYISESRLKMTLQAPGTKAAEVLAGAVRDNIAQIFAGLERS